MNFILNNFFQDFRKNIYELYLYSVNGSLISKEILSNPVQDMIVKDDYCILALLVNNRTSKLNNVQQSNSSAVHTSKIVFKEIFEYIIQLKNELSNKLLFIYFLLNLRLKTVQMMRLKAPITSLFLTREDSHLLVGLKDGKLIVITGERQIK